MDIPRGNFSSIRRDIPLSSILAEMAETSFSGHAMVNHEGTPISLVFSEGACILAEYRDLLGIPAWDAARDLEDDPVEVALYLLTGPQISLAAEFNAQASVSRSEVQPPRVRPADNQDAEPVPGGGKATRIQVPRGSFVEIRRNEPGLKILEGLKHSGFTGYAIFNSGSDNFTLVFSGGLCVLAGGGCERGTPVIGKVEEMKDASEVALYSLTEPQLALAREFNQGCQVGSNRQPPAARSAPSMCGREARGAPEPVPSGVKSVGHRSGPGKRLERERCVRAPAEAPCEDPVLRDLAALDDIDADQMAADLKGSYVSILDRLELGHLVGENKEKGVK